MKTKSEICHIFSDYPHHVVSMVRFFKAIIDENHPATFYIAAAKPETEKCYSEITDADITFYRHFNTLTKELKYKPNAIFIFHSLFDYEQWLALLTSGIIRRSVWVNWGADLYKHILPPPNDANLKRRIKYNIELYIKRIGVRFLKHVIALNSGDAELIKRKLGTPKKISILRYPMMDINKDLLYLRGSTSNIRTSVCRIICGNSGDPTNNHIAMLDALKHFADKNIEVHMPLNYGGNAQYIESVCTHGNRLYGNKFIPITNFLSKSEYDKILSKMDVGVFFHERQQGLYVVCSLLLQGKPMYIQKKVSSYREFKNMGMHMGDSSSISSMSYEDFSYIPESAALKTSEIAKKKFTGRYLAIDWTNFFSEISPLN